MNSISRRELIARAAVGAGIGAILMSETSEAEATPLGLPIGSQTWPTRAMLGDFPAYCKQMAEIGVKHLELCSPLGYGKEFASFSDPKETKKIMADHGLRSISSHFTLQELRSDQQKSLDWAHEIGIHQIIIASLGFGNGGSNPTLDVVKKASEEYNRIAEVSAKAGMQQGLHNEGFEMSLIDGKRTYDYLLELLDPKLVKFQFQMSTITAGFVAADYFEKYPGRFYSIHLQDIDMNAPGHPQVPLGKGSIDWIKTFKAAKTGGVKNYFVEQSWPLTQESVAYLKSLKA